MRGMILAAGFGTRLHPLTANIPKPLVKVAGRPLIEYPLLLLRRHGIREVIINIHHLGEMVRDVLSDGSGLGMSISYSEEPEILGTGGGIKKAESFFRGEPALVINGDTIIDVDLGKVVKSHEQTGGAATMVLIDVADKSDYGPVEADHDLRVWRIVGQPVGMGPEELRTLVFTGVHIVGPEIFSALPQRGFSSVIKEGYHRVLAAGGLVQGVETRGYWKSLDTMERIREAEADIKQKRFDPAALERINGFIG